MDSHLTVRVLKKAHLTKWGGAARKEGISLLYWADKSSQEGPLLLISGESSPLKWTGKVVHLPLAEEEFFSNWALLKELAGIEEERQREKNLRIRQEEKLGELTRIGAALSAEADLDKLANLILSACREVTRADGASLFLVEDSESGRQLRFAYTQSATLGVQSLDGTILPLNEESMVGYTILRGATCQVDNAEKLKKNHPFKINRSAVDDKKGYRTISLLAVPMRDHGGKIVGAIQLVNAKKDFNTKLTANNANDAVIPFDSEDVELLEAIASQAAVAFDNKRLLHSIENVFEGFVTASVTAIEARDPSTRGHSERVARLTLALAENVNSISVGEYKNINFSHDQLKELRYAALLHDFGKVGVREEVLGKEKKLYHWQVDQIRSRFHFAMRTLQFQHSQQKLNLALEGVGDEEVFQSIDLRTEADILQLQEWLETILEANEPSILDEDKASMLNFLSQKTFFDVRGEETMLVDPSEIHFLQIRRGTLDESERLEIESHVTHSYRFLSRIPWTPAMSNIPNIAYGHHEKLDGSGYPRKLTKADIPYQVRMMTIADIYDAMTSQRPYKKAMTPERAISVLKMEADAGQLDTNLLDIFVVKKIFDATLNWRAGDES